MARRKNPDVVESFEYKGHNVDIFSDPDPYDPREEFEHLGTILYHSDKYKLGDKDVDPYDASEIVNEPGVISLNVYAYIHGGIVLKTTPFSDPFDSGQSGVIYVTEKDALKAFNKKKMTPTLKKKVLNVLKSEVEEFSQYLAGEVYGYEIRKIGSSAVVDSLWGLIGLEYAVQSAKARIDE